MKMRWLERAAMNNALRSWVLRRWDGPRVLEGVELPAGSRVLEIGCGRGAAALFIARRFDCARIVCVDIDPAMIAAARRYVLHPPRWARGARREAIELVLGDAAALNLPGEGFDAAFLFGALHHIDDWRGALREVARVLRPGGIFAFGDVLLDRTPRWFNRWLRHVPFGPAGLREALGDAGLEVRRFRTAVHGHWCICHALKPSR